MTRGRLHLGGVALRLTGAGGPTAVNSSPPMTPKSLMFFFYMFKH